MLLLKVREYIMLVKPGNETGSFREGHRPVNYTRIYHFLYDIIQATQCKIT